MVKGLPENLSQKLQERRGKYDKIKEEWQKSRLDYLKTKIKYDSLIDLSLSEEDTKLPPTLLVSRDDWSSKIQNLLLNGKGNGLSPEINFAIQEVILDMLHERCKKLLHHWDLPESSEKNDCLKIKQLPILLQTDVELVQSNLDKAKFTVKHLKQELRLKDLLNSQIKVTKSLISNHALGHVATLNRLQVDYISAKRKNLELKMKCQELQIMQLTYTPDANRALSKIAHQFNEKISESEKHQAQLRGELEHYQSLGKSFDDIAERYSKVLEELQHVEWMLNSMNKCDEKEKNS